jgi:hypothetical protein
MTQQSIGGVFGEGNPVHGGETKGKTEQFYFVSRDRLTRPKPMAVRCSLLQIIDVVLRRSKYDATINRWGVRGGQSGLWRIELA